MNNLCTHNGISIVISACVHPNSCYERINLKFVPINEYERGEVYGLYSELLFPFVDAVYGWDNDFQKNYFTKYLTETIFRVEIDNVSKAVVCIVENY